MIPTVSPEVIASVGEQLCREDNTAYYENLVDELEKENLPLLMMMINLAERAVNMSDDKTDLIKYVMAIQVAIYNCIKQQMICNELP